MPRTLRPILPETYYFITSLTFQRVRLFDTPAYAQIVIDQWKHYSNIYEFQLDVYCVMPDHYHAVLNVGQKKNIAQILHAVNSYTATLINQAKDNLSKIKIWHGDPWDVVIRDDEMYWQKVAYTLLNPWRAGLVQDPLETYAFSNIDDWIARDGEEFVLDMFSRYKRQME